MPAYRHSSAKAMYGSVSGVNPFTTSLLQRGRYYRNRTHCPRCGAALTDENKLIDRHGKGLWCEECDT